VAKGKAKQRKVASSLDEIRAQAQPEVVEIPGFRPGTRLYVKLRPVDVTPHILSADTMNPLIAMAVQGYKEGRDKAEVAKEVEARAQGLLADTFDAICREAMVEPTYEEFTAVAPLTYGQKQAIFDWCSGDLQDLLFFRRK